ncbi:PIG-L deacetylase family protein [Salinibacterium sp. M195]|uniref:PIG-L deacetylase family protein n=1 Tax=Salinibacterium sp. M195 TaxID=2583374 RepID=UPI001C62F62D|nr:PIG-L family deacetylase [Salinibacterium sp. M195]QYH36145.1 PIG-L family deacetylase [Salinibacterium sp. M195]
MTAPASPLRVMGIGAHPDDLELTCAGTLAKYRSLGNHVTMCHIAGGDRGATSGTRAEVARIRRAEAGSAAALIGADYINLGVSDGEVDASNEHQKLLVTEAIRTARPDVIITHSAGDYMEDHNQASALAFTASFLATLPLYESDSPPLDAVPALFYMDTMAGLGFQPTEFVDITEQLDTKREMMRLHSSQLVWLEQHDEMDVLGQISTIAAYRGLQSGVRFAEAFAPCSAHLRTRTTRLLP